jgi:hypothetical protein
MFTTLKKALMGKPVLRNPDFKQPFTLQTDASDVGLRAVLSQTSEDGEKNPNIEREEKYGRRKGGQWPHYFIRTAMGAIAQQV